MKSVKTQLKEIWDKLYRNNNINNEFYDLDHVQNEENENIVINYRPNGQD